MLFKVAEDKNTARSVAFAIARNFDELPEKIQNLLFKVAEDKNTASSVAHVVVYCIDMLPVNVRDELRKRMKR